MIEDAPRPLSPLAMGAISASVKASGLDCDVRRAK